MLIIILKVGQIECSLTTNFGSRLAADETTICHGRGEHCLRGTEALGTPGPEQCGVGREASGCQQDGADLRLHRYSRAGFVYQSSIAV